MGHNQKSLGEWSSLYLLTGQLKPEVHVMSLSHLSTLIVKGSTDVGNGTTVLLKQASVHPKKVGPFIWKHELSKTHRRRSRSTRTPRNLKKLKLEPRLGFEILHRLSSINWRLGFSRSEFVKVGFFCSQIGLFFGKKWALSLQKLVTIFPELRFSKHQFPWNGSKVTVQPFQRSRSSYAKIHWIERLLRKARSYVPKARRIEIQWVQTSKCIPPPRKEYCGSWNFTIPRKPTQN